MNSMKEKIERDLKEALRAGEELRLSTLRMVSAAIHNREIEKRTRLAQASAERAKTGSAELTDEEITAVFRAEIKKRKDAALGFDKGGRAERAEKERKEEEVIQGYLPAELSDEDIEKIVREVVSGFGEVKDTDFGRVMGEVMKKTRGQASGDRVSGAVKKALTG